MPCLTNRFPPSTQSLQQTLQLSQTSSNFWYQALYQTVIVETSLCSSAEVQVNRRNLPAAFRLYKTCFSTKKNAGAGRQPEVCQVKHKYCSEHQLLGLFRRTCLVWMVCHVCQNHPDVRMCDLLINRMRKPVES